MYRRLVEHDNRFARIESAVDFLARDHQQRYGLRLGKNRKD